MVWSWKFGCSQFEKRKKKKLQLFHSGAMRNEEQETTRIHVENSSKGGVAASIATPALAVASAMPVEDDEEDEEEAEEEEDAEGEEEEDGDGDEEGRLAVEGGMTRQEEVGGVLAGDEGGGGGVGGMAGYWRQSRPSSPRMPPPEQSEQPSRPKSRHELQGLQAATRYNNLGYWRARRVTFYKNGDPYFPGVEFR